MTLFIPEGGAEISMHFLHDLDPDPWSITFGIAGEQGQSEIEDFDAALLAVQEAWDNNLKGVTDNQITLTSISARIGHGEAESGLTESIVGVRGGVSDTGLPQNCALLVKKNTNGVGRAARGRFFWPGMIPRDKVNEVGTLDSGHVTAMNTHFNDFLEDLQTAGPSDLPSVFMWVFHNDAELAPNQVVTLFVDPTLSTQRRRMR